jgi:hypothetical protein
MAIPVSIAALSRTARLAGLVLALGTGVVGGGCDAGDRSEDEAVGAGPGAADLERISALGYVSWEAMPEDDAGKQGVVQHDPEHTAPGLNLWNSLPRQEAILMDAGGVTRHTWRRDTGGEWGHIELLPDGDLLVFHQGPDRLIRLGWDSALRWERPMLAHHDSDVAENGDLLVLDVRRKMMRSEDGWRSVAKDFLVVLGPDGEKRREISFFDVLEGLFDPGTAEPESAGETDDTRSPVRFVDPVHVNTLAIVRKDHGGELRSGRVLFAARNLDLIGLLDLDSSRMVWSWGPGELDWPHQPVLTPQGTILVFDNGAHRGWSRIIEVDPARGEIVWEFRGRPPESFFSRTMGGIQLLANGNLLVSESERGRAFEITREGDVVWEYYNPDVDEAAGARATFYRMMRVEPGALDPGRLAEAGLAP